MEDSPSQICRQIFWHQRSQTEWLRDHQNVLEQTVGVGHSGGKAIRIYFIITGKAPIKKVYGSYTVLLQIITYEVHLFCIDSTQAQHETKPKVIKLSEPTSLLSYIKSLS